MAFTKEQAPLKMKSGEELKKVIEKAIHKVRGNKENDLCKFLPGDAGGYMHHFTLRKLKKTNPEQLSLLLQEFIIDSPQPKTLNPKQRAPRGSRKKKDLITFNRTDIERVLELARRAGYSDLVAKFSPKRSLSSLKRELIRSIRENRVNQDLWSAYVESIAIIKGTPSQGIEHI